MRKKLILSLLVLSSIGLTACNQGTTSLVSSVGSSSSSSQTSIVSSDNVSTVGEALQALKTIDFELVTISTNEGKVFDTVFTQDFTYDALNSQGYLVKDGKVYPYIDDNQTIRTGLESTFTSLYGQGGAASNFDLDLSLLDYSTEEVTSLKRDFVVPIIKMMGIGEQYYTTVLSCRLYLDGNKATDLGIEVNVDGSIYRGLILDYEGKFDYVDEFIKNDALSTIDPLLLHVKELFDQDNYTLCLYDDASTPDTPTSYSYFTDDYYIQIFTNAYIALNPLAQSQQYGYMEILNPDTPINVNGQDLIFDDIYMFTYSGSYETEGSLGIYTRDNPSKPGYAQGAFTYRCTDISQVMNYPRYSSLFSYLQVFEETESEIEGARTFSTTYQPVIADILDNYGLTGGFDNYGGIETLQIIDIPESNRANERVIFRLLTPGGTGYYDLDHTNFGSTEFAPFEDLRQSLNLD